MKKVLVNTICDLMQKQGNVYLFTADLGYGVVNRIVEEHPDLFFNVGICEQNLTSAAAGMALEGNIVFTYSIGNFPTLRCLEQIRNDVAYHHANVKIIAVGGGFAYGNLGMSHHATEDIAVMRAIPQMMVLSPADCYETQEAVKLAVQTDGPVYIRLGRGGEKDVTHITGDIKQVMLVKQTSEIQKSPKIAILGTGSTVLEAEKAVGIWNGRCNISAYSVAQIKPVNTEGILHICNENDYVITVEEHNVVGGLGSVVAELMAENTTRARLVRIGMHDEFTQVVGSPAYLRNYYGMDCEGICNTIEKLLGDCK